MIILKQKKYTLTLLATIVSALGSYAFNFAFMAHIYRISDHDKTYMGLTQVFFIVGMLIGNIYAGPIGDRLNRRSVLIFCEIIRIPFTLSFFFLENIWGLMCLHGMKTIFAGVSTPCKRAFILDILPSNLVPSGNNLFSASFAIVHILGPLIGTWCYAKYQALDVVLYFDLLTYIISIIFFLLIPRITALKTRQVKSYFIQELKDGLYYIKRRLDLRGLYERHALIGIFSGFTIPLILPFLVEVFGKSEIEYGHMMVLFGLGGVTGGLLYKKVTRKFSIGKVLFYSSLLEPFLMFIWAWGINYFVSCGLFYLWGMLFFIRAPSQFSYLSQHVDKAMISRTNAVLDFIFTLTNISASCLISLVGNRVETKNFLLACALFYMIINFLRINSLSSHHLKREKYEKA
ncbi:MAG: MFS transporter [Bacteriovoracaceae bacterium]|jgi:MFS family permease|nr:hypothetical protein [Halobacteriovoraceae bacterium]MDP7319462.1 MFS transporter [Bacteriovoracaceae bacterium]